MKKSLMMLLGLLLVAVAADAVAPKGRSSENGSKTADATTSIIQHEMSDNIAVNDSADALVDIRTTMGDIRVRLFGDTPRHRDNFLKLVNDGYYDGVLFHRVIDEFMVQAGDPDSKNAAKGQLLGSGSPSYQIDAEIVYPKHYHQRGALAAARTGDQVNPERRSSGSQFYIVTGRPVSESQLLRMEQQLVEARKAGIFNRLAQARIDQIRSMQAAGDTAGLNNLRSELIAITEREASAAPVATLTDEQRKAYAAVGGAPHLDGQYTVFGQVESGMDVVERIEKVATDDNDRPLEDVRIISMSVVK